MTRRTGPHPVVAQAGAYRVIIGMSSAEAARRMACDYGVRVTGDAIRGWEVGRSDPLLAHLDAYLGIFSSELAITGASALTAEDPLMTPREVADVLRVDAQTVRRWVAAGRCGAVRIPGGWRIRESAVRDMLAAEESAFRAGAL